MGSQRYNCATNTFSLWQAEGPILYTLRSTCVLSCPVVSHSAALWTVPCQGPPSMRLFRQEYWSGLPFPSPGSLSHPGIKPGSPALQVDFLLVEPSGKSLRSTKKKIYICVCVCIYIYMLSLAEPLKMWSGTHLEDVCVSVRGGWLKR